ncbi:kinase-like protein, partial [Thelephora ganbajun]
LSALYRVCSHQALLPRSLQIPVCYNRSDNPLYHGGFADVWKGEYQGRHVAVKALRVYSTSDFDRIINKFCKEVVMWKSLCHPNILPLLGVTMGDYQFAMVSEWMANGNINEFVKTNRDTNRFELLKDVARGLMYLHKQEMVHGDLKGANILVDQNGHARLTDFGLLTIVSDPTNFTPSSSVVACGTIRWMSPELLLPDQFDLRDSRPTKESDCYALGMVIYEVLSGQAPFIPFKEAIVMRKITEGEHPERPQGTKGALFTDDLWEMLNRCWATQIEMRPDIEAVEAVLEHLEQVSRTWEPPSPQANGDVETNEGDWNFATEVVHSVWFLISISFTPDACGRFHADYVSDPLSELTTLIKTFTTEVGISWRLGKVEKR